MTIKYSGESGLNVYFFYENDPEIPSFLIEKGIFKGEKNEFYLHGLEKETKIYAGLGEKNKTTPYSLLQTGTKIVRAYFEKLKEKSISFDFEKIEQNLSFFLLEGLFLEIFYSFHLKKEAKKRTLEEIIIKNTAPEIVRRAFQFSESRNLIRELVDLPANLLRPHDMAEKIAAVFENSDIQVEIWDSAKLEKEKMEGILSVGKGSQAAPYFIHLHYIPENPIKKLILIGKGITFDSGGLSLKPTDSMLDMKGDMAGAATVVGLLHLIEKIDLPIEINALIPLAENMISGNAYRVSDVIQYKNGKSVEVVNTDAEGRLVLADALIYSEKFESDLMIDLATLTGACMVALGTDIYGVFSNDEKTGIDFASFVNEKTSEKAWALPLFEKYKDQLKSKIADLKNTGKRWGGSITAALFLEEFVPGNKKWIHLDIAGPFFDDGIGIFDSMATGIPFESVALYLEEIFLKQ
ncbi:MAG TPA: aminopeptidase [Spirochaetia bacterium]|nr:aminopeptidase [Spirochaetia bacterium]